VILRKEVFSVADLINLALCSRNCWFSIVTLHSVVSCDNSVFIFGRNFIQSVARVPTPPGSCGNFLPGF